MSIGALSSSTAAVPASAPARADNPKQALTPDELVQLDKLKARDAAVRAHEAAHIGAAGNLALSGASFTYQRGPNGVNYAIGGEVTIDTSAGATPQETISKARRVQAAALAPADPSGADRAIAAQAAQQALKALADIATEKQAQALGQNVDVSV